jgi:hypothetical protein
MTGRLDDAGAAAILRELRQGARRQARVMARDPSAYSQATAKALEVEAEALDRAALALTWQDGLGG